MERDREPRRSDIETMTSPNQLIGELDEDMEIRNNDRIEKSRGILANIYPF
jgi:hypothetical protein